MSEPTLIDRLRHFEEAQLKLGDVYGAEVLHDAAKKLTELAALQEQVKTQEELMALVNKVAEQYGADLVATNKRQAERINELITVRDQLCTEN